MSFIGDVVGSVTKAVLPAVIDAEFPAADLPMHEATLTQGTSGTSGSLSSYVPPGGLHASTPDVHVLKVHDLATVALHQDLNPDAH